MESDCHNEIKITVKIKKATDKSKECQLLFFSNLFRNADICYEKRTDSVMPGVKRRILPDIFLYIPHQEGSQDIHFRILPGLIAFSGDQKDGFSFGSHNGFAG